jgi:hypothetical protein
MTALDCSRNRDVILKHFLEMAPWSEDAREHYVGCAFCAVEVTTALSRKVDALSVEAGGVIGLRDREEPALSAAASRSLEGSLQFLKREFGISLGSASARLTGTTLTPGHGPVVFILLARALRRGGVPVRGQGDEVVGQAIRENVWQLTEPGGGEWIKLHGPGVESAYGSSEMSVRLRLYAVHAETPGQFRPQVEVEPAPTAGPLTLVLQFALGDAGSRLEKRSLTVAGPLVAGMELKQDTSTVGEPLSLGALGTGGEMTVELFL